jgi:hypothetical protein
MPGPKVVKLAIPDQRSIEDVLRESAKIKFEHIAVIGWDAETNKLFHMADDAVTISELNYMVDLYKQHLLDMARDE